MPTQGSQLTHWRPIARDHKGLTLIQRTHDPAAVIAEFTLGNLLSHIQTL